MAASLRNGLRSAIRSPRILVPVVVVIVGGGGASAWAATRSDGAATATTATTVTTTSLVSAQTGNIDQTISASGTIAAATTSDLSFSVSGTVTAVNVKAGDKVTKGAVLATIDATSLQNSYAQAESTVASNASTVDSDVSSSASSEQLAADEATLSSSRAQLAEAKAALADAELVAPVAGTVNSLDLTVGQQVGSGSTGGSTGASAGSGATGTTSTTSTAEIEVVSTGAYVANLTVDDTEVSELKVGNTATVKLGSSGASTNNGFGGAGGFGPGGGTGASAGTTGTTGSGTTGTTTTTSSGTWTGTITSIANTATSTSGVSSYAVVVTLSGDQSTGLYPGASATSTITYSSVKDVIEVPTTAIHRSGTSTYVLKSVNGKVSQQTVTTGAASAGYTQITKGLEAGDQVQVTTVTRKATGTGTTGTRTGTSGFGGDNGPPSGFTGGAPGGGQ